MRATNEGATTPRGEVWRTTRVVLRCALLKNSTSAAQGHHRVRWWMKCAASYNVQTAATGAAAGHPGAPTGSHWVRAGTRRAQHKRVRGSIAARGAVLERRVE